MAGRKKKDTVRNNRILGLLLAICGLLIAVSLVSHNQLNDSEVLLKAFEDNKLIELFDTPFDNRGGIIGVFISYGLLSLFGYLAFFLPLAIWSVSFCVFFSTKFLPTFKRIGYAAMFLYFIGILFSLHGADTEFFSIDPGVGGLIGHYSAALIKLLTGSVIAYTITISLIIGSIIWVMPSNMKIPGRNLPSQFIKFKNMIFDSVGSVKVKKPKKAKIGVAKPETESDVDFDIPPVAEAEPGLLKRIVRIKKAKPKGTMNLPAGLGQPELELDSGNGDHDFDPATAAGIDGPQMRIPTTESGEREDDVAVGYVFPSTDLLADPPDNEPSISNNELEATAEALKDTLATFGVTLANGEVEIYPGPIITRYEFKPGPGIKVSQIVNLADDLALAMKAKRIRIVAPIPGKSAVGVEIPNRLSQTVYIKEIIGSRKFQENTLKLPLAIGKTLSGQPHVVDLAAMPHLLIAGATGTGKSVCLNCIITSMLYHLSPENLRLILIDPKMLELSVYNDLPHLEKPVVTEMKYAERVLAEAVVEMEDRYRKLAKEGVRNIADFNETADKPIPYVVIIVDELADLMMVGSNRVETLITRLAQMARAVGIHLILATQRPSVDVITGLIKANFSTRIAFQVATKVDSRTILDLNGAEKLLGRGDMLYMNPSFPEPKRVHGGFISGKETKSLCKFLGSQEYAPEKIKNFDSDENKPMQYDPAADAVYREAIKVVVKHKQGSVSLLQRRLGIGYQRAARLIDQLEENGIVGPYDGSKAREVLMDEDALEEMFSE